MVVFKMREGVPTARYSPVCNVLRQWKTSLILTYRVYRLYDTHSIGSIGNQAYRTRWSCLKCVIVYLARDIPPFVMYCVNGKPRSSLLDYYRVDRLYK